MCTCASKILGSYRAPYTATAIEKLRAHGAIPFGRMNMDEFAMGSSTENSSMQLTRNPWDLSRVPGIKWRPAAAVAADIAFGALGTDTGGSIRQPAALSGVVGFKPSYGRVSRFWSRRFCLLSGSNRTSNENCTRFRLAHECDCRTRPAGFDFA